MPPRPVTSLRPRRLLRLPRSPFLSREGLREHPFATAPLPRRRHAFPGVQDISGCGAVLGWAPRCPARCQRPGSQTGGMRAPRGCSLPGSPALLPPSLPAPSRTFGCSPSTLRGWRDGSSLKNCKLKVKNWMGQRWHRSSRGSPYLGPHGAYTFAAPTCLLLERGRRENGGLCWH